MKNTVKKNLAILCTLVLLIILCLFFADLIQHDFGSVKVTKGKFEVDALGTLSYKLYVPKTADPVNKAPAVLLLHGYQNDNETSAAYAIELARRGAVVLSLDEFGHGYTSIGMKERGWVNHKVNTTYGMDSEENGTFVTVNSGIRRYKLMMNFSNLSFFDERYTKGSDGSVLKDSSMGGIAAYAFLAGMDFVDSSRMAVSGHSMGTWASWTVSAAYSGTDIMPKATVLQCGELFTTDAYDANKIKFNNVLLLTAKYDEFNYFRDFNNFIKQDMIKSDLRTQFLGTDWDKAEWNTTFGSFEDGTARRSELIINNHRLTTHDPKAMAAALNWFENSLALDSKLNAANQIFMLKEVLVFISMLCAVFSMLPFANILLQMKFFSVLNRRLLPDSKRERSMKKWWKAAIITALISFSTYPFMTQLGHGLLPLPEGIFRMTIGNGFLSWYLLLIVIMLITTYTSIRGAKKKGLADGMMLGMGYGDKKVDFSLMGKGALLSICMALFMYILTVLSQSIFKLDFRFIWPFFKGFTLVRFGQFLVYIPVFALFFLLNNSKIFSQMRSVNSADEGALGFLNAWWKNAFCMAGGILLIILLEYVPFFLGIAPGADLLFGTTFGGPFMSLLIVFFPQILVFSLLCTYLYRKTSTVYPGAFVVAILACWIVTGGSAMF